MSSNNVVGEWYFNDFLGHRGKLPRATFELFYTKCLMDVVAADGVINDAERDWVTGFAAISGYPEEVIQELEKYQPVQNKEGVAILQTADGEIHPKEAQAIFEFRKKLGATDEQIETVRHLYDDDVKLRKKRVAILLPKSLDTVLSELTQAN